LKIFFDKHAEHEKERNTLISQKKIAESIEKKEMATKYKKLALDIMKRYSGSM